MNMNCGRQDVFEAHVRGATARERQNPGDAHAKRALAEPGPLSVDIQNDDAGLTYSNCGRQSRDEIHTWAATACERQPHAEVQSAYALAEPGHLVCEIQTARAGLTLCGRQSTHETQYARATAEPGQRTIDIHDAYAGLTLSTEAMT